MDNLLQQGALTDHVEAAGQPICSAPSGNETTLAARQARQYSAIESNLHERLGSHALATTSKRAHDPRKASALSVPSDRNSRAVRPIVKTLVGSSMRAPNSNSSGAMKRVEPNMRPISLRNGPSRYISRST